MTRLSNLRTGSLYSQESSMVLVSVGGWLDPRVIVRPERVSQWKITMTSSRFEPAIFLPVRQCRYNFKLNNLCMLIGKVNFIASSACLVLRRGEPLEEVLLAPNILQYLLREGFINICNKFLSLTDWLLDNIWTQPMFCTAGGCCAKRSDSSERRSTLSCAS